MKSTFDEQNINSLIEKLEEKPEYNIRTADRTYLTNEESISYLKENATAILVGAQLKQNEYGHRLFADYFFFITGFHGFHVFSGSNYINNNFDKCNKRYLGEKRSL